MAGGSACLSTMQSRSTWEADLRAASKNLMRDRLSLAAPTLCSYGAHYGWELAVILCLSLPIALCAWIIGVCHRTHPYEFTLNIGP